MVLSCHHITKSFGEETILQDVSFHMNEYDKLAIVGSNGSGKTTLLRVLMKEIEADKGEVILGKGITLGYLSQYQNVDEVGSIYEVVLSAKEELAVLEKEIRKLEEKISFSEGKEQQLLLKEYDQKNHLFERENGYSYRSEGIGVLKGLGFEEADFEKTMDMLSGGEKTRVALGKLLLTKPDILLLDEPINHLDLNSIQWLENFLMNYKGSVILVAHDRYFLDRIANKVLDLSLGNAYLYQGNYTDFVKQKEIRNLTLQREYEKQQKEIAHQEEVIAQLRSFNREKSIKRADSRQKTLDKIQRIEQPIEEKHEMRIHLQPDVLSGKDVLQVKHIGMSFSKELFTDISFEVSRGERIAIIGDNGTGKTTILKLIMNKIPLQKGEIQIGANVTIGYYDQEQQSLDDELTLFEELQSTYPDLNDTKVRNILAAFLFTGEDALKNIKNLSGGERGRVSLAKLMLSGANFLILDEPTNHLDMESKEILEKALLQYEGTLLYISHDRYFVNKTADKILELSDGKLNLYYGNYDYYIEKKAETTEAAKVLETPTIDSVQKQDWIEQKQIAAQKRKQKKQIEATEQKIEELEEKIQKIDLEFQNPEYASNSFKLNELAEERKDLEGQLEELYELWENLSDEMC